MDKITCKNCGTKYPGEVAKCPVCGASNLPSVSGDFEFLDDDFEVKTDKPAASAPAEEAAPAAPAVPAEPAAPEKPVSKDTGAYNWEDIIAEINGTKPAEKAAGPEPETKWVPEEPKKTAPAAPAWKQVDEDDEDDEDEEPEEKARPVRQPRERRQSSKSGTAVIAVVLVAALLVVAFFAAKHFGLFDKEEPEPETPELPVAQEKDVDCTGVTLSVNELTLTAEGASETLTATLTPADCTEKVNWVSADPSVAIVDANGKVTAVAEGKANILVSCGDYAATCMVTVDFTPEDETGGEAPEQEPETETGEQMELSATDITMTYPGELARLYVNNSGDKEVKWSTDNETLLSIDSTGLIMARATGTAHVYAEVDGEKLECIVRCNLGGVEGEPITVSLNSTDISMFYEGETFQFKVNYENGEPEGVTHEWSSSDTSVCTIDENGIVTAVGNGTAYISTVADGVNLKCIVRVNIESSTTEG